MALYISEMDHRRRSLVLLLGFVFVVKLCLASANVVLDVKHKFGARGERSLSVLRAHDSHRHGRMLSVIDFPLGGEGRADQSSLFYTKIGIGTPSKDFHVQVDTGSDMLWVNCAGCANCPKETKLNIKLATYDPKGSSTAKPVTCEQDDCATALGAGLSNCRVGQSCEYSLTYGDGSTNKGYFVRDDLQFNRVSGNLETTSMNGSAVFGCGVTQSGASDESVDGIIGFGAANSSMISQLASAGNVKKVFSHCLDGSSGGGIFAIGEVVQPKFSSTPLVPDMPHYNVNMKAVDVGGDVLELPTDIFDTTGSNGGTIIDSGTTLAYLPDMVFKPLIQKILARQPGLKTYIVEDQFRCFPYKGNVDDGFPVVTFHFENSLTLSVYPHEYLFPVSEDWCIGWMGGGFQSREGKDLTILGDLAIAGKLVVYDIENQSIGWTEYNCSSSIKVKDEQSGNVYSVHSHNLDPSSACSLNTGKILALLLLMAIFCTSI